MSQCLGITPIPHKRCHMSRLYGPVHRSLQDRFETRRLSDNVETRVVLTEIPQEHKAFIESRDMFFLSTIDHQGRPTVSYKGGDPGFVRVLGSKTLAFPCYDGNGMFYSGHRKNERQPHAKSSCCATMQSNIKTKWSALPCA